MGTLTLSSSSDAQALLDGHPKDAAELTEQLEAHGQAAQGLLDQANSALQRCQLTETETVTVSRAAAQLDAVAAALRCVLSN